MAALDQYLDLYRTHRDLIDANGAPALNALRPEAAGHLAGAVLPRKGDEDYANVDIEEMLAPDFGLNLQKIDIDVNTEATFRCDVPVSSQSVMMNINDTFSMTGSARAALPEGVEAGSLRELAAREPATVTQFYGKAADMGNPLVALNTLFAQDGLYLRVKRGTRLEKPLQLVNILSNSMPLMAVRRVLVIVEDEAEAKLLVCDHTQRDDVSLMSLETVEIFVGERARFDYYNIEESTVSTSRLYALYSRQKAGSVLNIDGITLFNGTTRNEYYCSFEGPDAGLRLYGMGIEDKKRVISTYSRIAHNVPDCKSDELFKFSADDESSGAFTGRIYVAEGASGTEAYQASRNIVAGSKARIFSKPQLEIYNDDVKCSHGCAIGQLDPMQIFYMRTRGLSEETARLLLRQAFMADVIAAIDVEGLRDRLRLLTERRFAGLESACASCAACQKNTPDQND